MRSSPFPVIPDGAAQPRRSGTAGSAGAVRNPIHLRLAAVPDKRCALSGMTDWGLG